MAELSAAFIDPPANRSLDKQILYGLQYITEFLGADRSSLLEFVESVSTFRVIRSWAVKSVEPLPAAMTVRQYPWCAEQLRQGGIVRCIRLEDLPEGAAIDRESFRKAGSKSVILLPLRARDAILGALSFATLHFEKVWSDERTQGLRSIGELFASALIRQRDEDALRQSYDRIEDLAGRLITAQEAERTRIARELHDDITQQLAALSIALSGLKHRLDADAADVHDALARLQQRTITLADAIRHLSHDLHPGVLQHAGLVAALKAHCAEFGSQHAIEVTLSANGLGAIPQDVGLCLYRVAPYTSTSPTPP